MRKAERMYTRSAFLFRIAYLKIVCVLRHKFYRHNAHMKIYRFDFAYKVDIFSYLPKQKRFFCSNSKSFHNEICPSPLTIIVTK